MKKYLGTTFRLAIAVAGIAYIGLTLNWSDRVVMPDGQTIAVTDVDAQWVTLADAPRKPGDLVMEGLRVGRAPLETGESDQARFEPSVSTTIVEANTGLLVLGIVIFAPIYLIGSVRWYLLMKVRGLPVTFAKTFRLTMVGVFFNICMPGSTGGDLMKAYYAAKGSGQRTVAVMTVVVDRVCGLLGLIIFVAVIGLTMLDNPTIRQITVLMWAVLIGFLVFLWLYSHPKLRAAVGFDWLMGKLPGGKALRSIDDAVVAYRDHKPTLGLAVLITLPIHLMVALAISLAGYALGISQPISYLLGTIPVAVLVGSLPISGPLGLGPMDIVTVELLKDPVLASAHQVAMMMVVYRFYAIVIGLLGSLALVRGGIHLHTQDDPDDAADQAR